MTVSSAARPRVLVVAYDFPPHAAIGTMRTLRVVRELDARGWDVTVLTGAPETYLPTTPVDPMLLHRVPPDVRVVRSKSLRPWNAANEVIRRGFQTKTDRGRHAPEEAAGSRVTVSTRRHGGLRSQLTAMHDVLDAALSIPDKEVGWLLPAVVTGARRQTGRWRPDVIYSSAPPWTGHIVAAALKRLIRCPWVADFRDPWARAPWRNDRHSFVLKASAFLEPRIVRRADRIVFVTAANAADFERVYGAASSKFIVVPNGCDPAEIEAARDESPARSDDTHVMLHAGSLYAGRTPVPLFRAVARAIAGGRIDPDRFRLRFLGVNALSNVDLHRSAKALGVEAIVEFAPRVPRAEGIRAMTAASSLLLLQPGHAVSIPGKIYEYLAAGRPILAIADQEEIQALLARSGAGSAAASDDEAAIADALVKTIDGACTGAGSVARELFDGNIGAGKIADLLASLVPTTRLETRSRLRVEATR